MRNPIVDRPAVLAKIKEDYRKRDLAYDAKKSTISSRWQDLVGRFDPAKQPISQQILDEANWLISYSDDWARASAVLDRLEASFANGTGTQTLEQQADGSWGPGCTEWYRKIEPTVDALNEAQQAGGFAQTPSALTYMNPLTNLDWMLSYLDSLRVSHIWKTGRNNRDEFGALLTAL